MKKGMDYDMDYGKGGKSMKMDYDMDYSKKGSNDGHGPVAEAGFKCKGKFPLTGKFWTKDPKNGQA